MLTMIDWIGYNKWSSVINQSSLFIMQWLRHNSCLLYHVCDYFQINHQFKAKSQPKRKIWFLPPIQFHVEYYKNLMCLYSYWSGSHHHHHGPASLLSIERNCFLVSHPPDHWMGSLSDLNHRPINSRVGFHFTVGTNSPSCHSPAQLWFSYSGVMNFLGCHREYLRE